MNHTNLASFMPGRMIQENNILVHEIIHTMKRKTGRGGLMAFKLDMEKAYNKIEWSYLVEVLNV